jgi:hypothetical protein
MFCGDDERITSEQLDGERLNGGRSSLALARVMLYCSYFEDLTKSRMLSLSNSYAFGNCS